jgi:2-C-methyl-D-erythritol 4-phosphate cytidylyltransferase
MNYQAPSNLPHQNRRNQNPTILHHAADTFQDSPQLSPILLVQQEAVDGRTVVPAKSP